MKLALQLALAVLMMLPSLPVASAQDTPGVHDAPQPAVPDVPPPSGRPLGDTRVIPVDNAQDAAMAAGADAANRSRPATAAARQGLNTTQRTVPAGTITLFQDDLEGNRSGGYGSWRTDPPTGASGGLAWGVKPTPAGHVLSNGVLDQGHYPGSTTSLLVTPELDLKTGTVPPAGLPPAAVAQVQALAALLSLVDTTLPGSAPCVPFTGTVVCDAYATARPVIHDSTKNGPAAPAGVEASAVYRLLLDEAALAVYNRCAAATSVTGCPANPLLGVAPSHGAEPRDSAFTFAYRRRFNLAGDANLAQGSPGRDGVQLLVFTKPPTLSDVRGCFSAEDYARANVAEAGGPAQASLADAPACTKVQTLARDGRPARPFGNAVRDPPYDDAYTGYDGWRTDYIDLTAWAGQSVWVGFLFASGGIGGGAYFQNHDLFNTQAGFYGLELDNLTLRVPAQEQSVRVRPFTEPSVRPEGKGNNVTLAVGSDIPVAVDVANVGTNPVGVSFRLRLLDRDDPAARPLFDSYVGNATLPPASVHRVAASLAGFAPHRANYTLSLQAVTLNTSAATPEADPSDDVSSMAVDIQDVARLRFGAVERSAASIGKDGSEVFRLNVTNVGNLPSYVNATAQLVSAQTHAVTSVLPFEGSATLEGPPLGVGKSRTLEWSMSGASQPLAPGQYNLFVRVNDGKGFDASRDLLPASLQAFRSTWTDKPPKLDGVVEALWGTPTPAEFRDPYNVGPGVNSANRRPTADQVVTGDLRVMNDADNLYVAFTVPAAPALQRAFALLLDAGADGALAPGTDNGYLADGENGTAAPVRLNLTYGDADRVRADDIRLSGGGPLAFQRVLAGDPDHGLPLSDGDHLDLFRALHNGGPPVIDLDDSDTLSLGDFDLASGSFVTASNASLGQRFQRPSSAIAEASVFTFADDAALPGQHGRAYDPGEPVCATVESSNGRTAYTLDPTAHALVSGGTCPTPFSPIQPVVRFHDANGDHLFDAGDVLYLQPWRLPWSPAGGLGGAAGVATAGAAPAQATTYEFKLPLPGGQAGGAGGDVRLLALRDSGAGFTYRFPPAPVVDGEGLTPRDGSLADELASWFKVGLAGPPQPQVADGKRILSLGFGVERAPPPMFEQTLEDCSGLAGWSQTGILSPSVGAGASEGARVPEGEMRPSSEKWNCAPYGPDGKLRLYEGLAPGALCGGMPCPPWSGVQAVAPNHSGFNPNDLVTPPFRIGPVADPYLILRHQYSTQMTINDEAGVVQVPESDDFRVNPRTIHLDSVARVFVQPWDDAARSWEAPILVRPAGGYSTEELTGIGREDGVQRTIDLEYDGGRACNVGADNAYAPPCGWWWPTGYQGHVQPVGQPIATGRGFTGSPWAVDRLPLFGSEHGFDQDKTLVLANRTVRLLFEFYPSVGVPDTNPAFPEDLGWRIDGLAVTEGPSFAKDVAVTNLSVVAPFYDPAKLGLGPGTTVMVNVTVANQGLLAASGVHVCLSALVLGAPGPAASPCDGGAEQVVDDLAAGETRSALLPFQVPDAEGELLALRAAARIETGDDFPANNELRSASVLRTHAVPDAAVAVDATPGDGPASTARTLLLHVTNRGNVPLRGFDVVRTVVRSDGADSGTPVLSPKTWHVNDTLAVGRDLDLQSFNESRVIPAVLANDLVLPAPGRTGTFTLFGQVKMPGDPTPGNDVDIATIRAFDILYQDGFDGVTGLAIPAGAAPVWSIQPGGFVGKRLLAGDPVTGEIPVNTNSTLELPQLDLSGAKDAVLTFRQRYDLETGFDAARVEVSSNGGQTWRPLRPVPHQGTPDGYPSLNLTGTNALLEGGSEAAAVAYTGHSADLPGAASGWAQSEFNLASDPELSRSAAIDAFRLDGLPSRPDAVPLPSPTGDLQYRSAGWTLPEPNAESRQRYWWIENLTYEAPKPHAGQQMWWSGTSGPDAAQPVRDDLSYSVTLPAFPHADGQQMLLTWWEWQAGGADGGTGGHRTVTLPDHPRTPFALAREPSGWRQMAVDVTDLAQQQVALVFTYDSVPAPGFPDPRTTNNLGWFLDDVQVVSSQLDAARGVRHDPVALGPLEGLEGVDPQSITGSGWLGSTWHTEAVPGEPPATSTRWSIASLGAAAQDGGWHIAPVGLPGRGQVPAWRFSADNAQGYPDQAESRLVTPVVDLGTAEGDLRLQFDQRYWFESALKCPLDQIQQGTPEGQQDQGCFRSAVDGGAVEYQVLDRASGTFGPWQALGAQFDRFPDRLLFEAQTDDCQAVGSSRVDLQACKLEYSIVSPK